MRSSPFSVQARILLALLLFFSPSLGISQNFPPPDSSHTPLSPGQLKQIGISAIEWAKLPDGIKVTIHTESKPNGTIVLEHHILDLTNVQREPATAYDKSLKVLRTLKSQ